MADDAQAPERELEESAEEQRSKLGKELVEGRAGQTALAALVAWLITVVPAAFARGSGPAAKLFCVLAIGAGAGGPILNATGNRFGRHVGITLFVSLSVLTWILTGPAIHPARLDPTRAAIGAIAWGVFVLSWSERWSKPDLQEAEKDAPLLQARATLPRFAVPIASLGVAVSLMLVAVAWRVRDADRALVAQTLGIGSAVWLLGAASTVAIARGRRRATVAKRVTPQALRRLLLLATVAVAGAIIIALR